LKSIISYIYFLMRNYYTILEIKDFADYDEIKAAHRRLSKKYHPDLNNGSRHSEEKFKEIQHAYEQLSDPAAKAIHDSLLQHYYAGDNIFETRPPQGNYYPPPPPYHPFHRWLQKPGSAIIIGFALIAIIRIIAPKPWETGALNTAPVKINNIPFDQYARDSLRPLIYADPPPDSGKTFKIGSTKDAVRQAQGTPLWVTKMDASETWAYGNSLVVFRDGIVVTYDNIGKNLHIAE